MNSELIPPPAPFKESIETTLMKKRWYALHDKAGALVDTLFDNLDHDVLEDNKVARAISELALAHAALKNEKGIPNA